MRKLKYTCAAVLFFLPLQLMAQGYLKPLRKHRPATGSMVIKNYTDSLTHFADSIYRDSISVHRDFGRIDTAPFFLPLTFYSNVAHRAFSLDEQLSPVDYQLLKIYLSHPELVANTQSRLKALGSVIAPHTVTENPTSIIEKAAPQEPDALPVDVVVLKPNFWKFGGDYYLQFLQNYLTDNWYQGGESNYSMVGAVTLVANYNNKQKVKWENKLEMKLGMQTTQSDSIHNMRTSEDLIRYTGKLGLQATKRWYYTFQLLAQTQWTRHFKPNSREVQSDFLSPLNVNLSIGMDYSVNWLKNHLTGTIHLAPLAYNFKYTDRQALSKQNGIPLGHHALNDFGSQITIDLNGRICNNLNWNTHLYSYTTYKRLEMAWENTFTFQFNRFFSTKLFIHPRFDDGHPRDNKLGYWMFKEFVSLGFSYSF